MPGLRSRRPCRRRRRGCSHSQSLLSPSPSSWGRRCPEFPADEPPPRPRARCATRRWEPAGLLRRGRLVNAPQLGQRALDLTVEAALPTAVILWSPSDDAAETPAATCAPEVVRSQGPFAGRRDPTALRCPTTTPGEVIAVARPRRRLSCRRGHDPRRPPLLLLHGGRRPLENDINEIGGHAL